MVDENEFYRQATLHIFSSLNIDTAMRRCKAYMRQHMPISGMYFTLYDPGLNIGRMFAGIWPPHYERSTTSLQMPEEIRGWLKTKWAKREPLWIINDWDREEPQARQVLAHTFPEVTSVIFLELALEETRIGQLLIFAEGKNRYREHHGKLISLLQKPFAIAMANILQHQELVRLKDILADDNRYLQQQMATMTGDTVIGADFGLRGVMEMVRQVSQIDSPVLLLGETGVGKEVIANALHFSSKRRKGPFIKVNCGAISEPLVDSELFGHEKGAFTGAFSRKRGRFERAHGGTIFLDEIGELPPAVQVRLLRVLQQHEIERVGGSEVIPVDVRIICATHRNMEALVRSGRFREDLWFRINVFPIMIPPLRQRTEDIPALVNHLVERKSKELKMDRVPAITEATINRMQAYQWPGNVRELENLVERAMIWGQSEGAGEVLSVDDLMMRPRKSPADEIFSPEVFMSLEDVAAAHIRKVLEKTGGKVEGPGGAAMLLKVHPSTLRGRMKKLGIAYGRGKGFRA